MVSRQQAPTAGGWMGAWCPQAPHVPRGSLSPGVSCCFTIRAFQVTQQAWGRIMERGVFTSPAPSKRRGLLGRSPDIWGAKTLEASGLVSGAPPSPDHRSSTSTHLLRPRSPNHRPSASTHLLRPRSPNHRPSTSTHLLRPRSSDHRTLAPTLSSSTGSQTPAPPPDVCQG